METIDGTMTNVALDRGSTSAAGSSLASRNGSKKRSPENCWISVTRNRGTTANVLIGLPWARLTPSVAGLNCETTGDCGSYGGADSRLCSRRKRELTAAPSYPHSSPVGE